MNGTHCEDNFICCPPIALVCILYLYVYTVQSVGREREGEREREGGRGGGVGGREGRRGGREGEICSGNLSLRGIMADSLLYIIL